jgi:threonine/homoserine/homoserine lactone efflux protein
MPDTATYAAFLGAVLAYQLSGIGPDMMLVIGRGVAQGWRVALATAVGCVAAGFIQIPLLALGLASLISSSPALYALLQLLGAGYLIYVGLKFLFAGKKYFGFAGTGEASKPSLTGAFRQGVICNLTNPTVLAFMLAILPQFVHLSSGPAAMQFLILGATMKLSGLVMLGSVALASGAVGGWLMRNRSFQLWQQRFAGAIMIGLGLQLLLSGNPRADMR